MHAESDVGVMLGREGVSGKENGQQADINRLAWLSLFDYDLLVYSMGILQCEGRRVRTPMESFRLVLPILLPK